MRLSELMAAVRMTPIREREEEDGLSSVEVDVHCWDAQDAARSRQEQEEEIRQYQLFREEEDERALMAAEAAVADAEQQQESEDEDEDESEDEAVSEQSADAADSAEVGSDGAEAAVDEEFLAAALDWRPQYEEEGQQESWTPEVMLPLPEDDSSEESEEEEQQHGITADEAAAETEAEEVKRDELQQQSELSAAEGEDGDTAEDETTDELQAETVLHSEQPEEPQSPHSLDRALLSCPAWPPVLPVFSSPAAFTLEEDPAIDHCSLPLISPLPPAQAGPLTPSMSCSACGTVGLSLQHWQSECEQLTSRMSSVTAEGGLLYAEYEKKSLKVRELLMEAERREEEEDTRRRREEEDYRSLYFAYVQLEQAYNALQLQTAGRTAEQEAEAEEAEAAQCEEDYAAIVEEKRKSLSPPVPQQETEPAIVDVDDREHLCFEILRLREENARLQSELSARDDAEAEQTYRVRYQQLLTLHSSQSEHFQSLSSALSTMEAVQRMEAETDDAHHAAVSEQALQLASLRQELQQATTETAELRQSRAEAETQLDRLTQSLCDARDTAEYLQVEKAASEEEVTELKRVMAAREEERADDRSRHDALQAEQRRKDAELLAVIDDSLDSINSTRLQLQQKTAQHCNLGLAFTAAQHTLQLCHSVSEQQAEQLQRLQEQTAVLRDRQGRVEQELKQSEESRLQAEGRLSSSEERVRCLTDLMSAVEDEKKAAKEAQAALTQRLSQAEQELASHRQRQAAVTASKRQHEDRITRLEGELEASQQREQRARQEAAREKSERWKEAERRKAAEAEAERVRVEKAEWEGKYDAVAGKERDRLSEREKAESRLREKDLLIARLGKTVKQMHSHIEGEGADRLRRLQTMLTQYQRLLAHVLGILKHDRYSEDHDVKTLLRLVESRGAGAAATEAAEEQKAEQD